MIDPSPKNGYPAYDWNDDTGSVHVLFLSRNLCYVVERCEAGTLRGFSAIDFNKTTGGGVFKVPSGDVMAFEGDFSDGWVYNEKASGFGSVLGVPHLNGGFPNSY